MQKATFVFGKDGLKSVGGKGIDFFSYHFNVRKGQHIVVEPSDQMLCTIDKYVSLFEVPWHFL